MGVVDSIKDISSKATETGEAYVKKTQEYYTLKAFQQIALSTSLFCKMMLIGSLFFLGLVFIMVATTIAIGNYLNNLPLGCLTVAGALFVLAGIIYRLRKRIDTQVIRKLSSEFFN
ncbi:MAG: hypothetical protein WBG90_12335 [Saonia sp.]